MVYRNSYLLTANTKSLRCLFSIDVLTNIGFNVIIIDCIPNDNKVLSNKISMQYIYDLIKNSDQDYSYVFEDDINILEPIKLDEIIEYEEISEMFFYLGICENGLNVIFTGHKINNHYVYSKSGCVRGLHAIGLSKKGQLNY